MLEGVAYGRQQQSHDAFMTEVEPETPGGEFLRRYWQPIGLSSELGTVPRKVRILGEDLILFRDLQNRLGLLYPRCCHRGTSLYYGQIEDKGIRCCYHGWLFDTEGHCLEMPCEPPGSHDRRNMVRQPWYPVKEYHGLIFAYLGPPDKLPAFPKFDVIENAAADDGWVIEANRGLGGGGDLVRPQPCNWLQLLDNVMDPLHVFVLHSNFSTRQFTDIVAKYPDLEFEYTDYGMKSIQHRKLDKGVIFLRKTEAFMPNIRLVPNPRAMPGKAGFGKAEFLSWIVPLDNTNTALLGLAAYPADANGDPIRPQVKSDFGGKQWHEMSEEEHRSNPGDWEAITSQGPITIAAEEHLVESDKGVRMLRRLVRKQIETTRSGKDPVGAITDQDERLIITEAGNYLIEDSDQTPK